MTPRKSDACVTEDKNPGRYDLIVTIDPETWSAKRHSFSTPRRESPPGTSSGGEGGGPCPSAGRRRSRCIVRSVSRRPSPPQSRFVVGRDRRDGVASTPRPWGGSVPGPAQQRPALETDIPTPGFCAHAGVSGSLIMRFGETTEKVIVFLAQQQLID